MELHVLRSLTLDGTKRFWLLYDKEHRLASRIGESMRSAVKRWTEGLIRDWHDRRITAGTEWDGKIDQHLNSAHIILLLVSSDFLASKYCHDVEVKIASVPSRNPERPGRRHRAGGSG